MRLVLDVAAMKRRRLGLGMSQIELGEAAGIHYVTVSRIETGCQQANPSTIKKLALALGCVVLDIAEVK